MKQAILALCFAAAHAAFAGPPSGLDVTFASGDQRIAASWSVDNETGLPRDDLHISIDPIDKAANGDDAAVELRQCDVHRGVERIEAARRGFPLPRRR